MKPAQLMLCFTQCPFPNNKVHKTYPTPSTTAHHLFTQNSEKNNTNISSTYSALITTHFNISNVSYALNKTTIISLPKSIPVTAQYILIKLYHAHHFHT